MAPTEVRDGIVAIGFELSSIKHDNPMASVHAVLKRFVDAGDAAQTKDKKYRWIGRVLGQRSVSDTPYTQYAAAVTAAEDQWSRVTASVLGELHLSPKLLEDLDRMNREIENSRKSLQTAGLLMPDTKK
jgi:hypothetical protein